MARSTDVVVLGAGLRGLWLATQMKKLGWKALWAELESATDDGWAWQVGSEDKKVLKHEGYGEFVRDVIYPKTQKLAFQIVTPNGPLELSGASKKRGFTKVFGERSDDLLEYTASISQATSLDDGARRKWFTSHTRKIFEEPLMSRWCLEWLGGLQNRRSVSLGEWVSDYAGDPHDPEAGYWLISDTYKKTVERAIEYAEHQGVEIARDAKIVEITVEEKTVTGVELAGGGEYIHCRKVIAALSRYSLEKLAPRFAEELKIRESDKNLKWVWVRCDFKMKKASRPVGLEEFSSFVIDPLMPYVGENFGLLKWESQSEFDQLLVWIRIPAPEFKHGTYLKQLSQSVSKHLENLFPWFDKLVISKGEFGKNVEARPLSGDVFPVSFTPSTVVGDFLSKVPNAWLCGSEYDQDLDLISTLKTEAKLFEELKEIRLKEIKRDRKIHPSRDGKDLGATKSI